MGRAHCEDDLPVKPSSWPAASAPPFHVLRGKANLLRMHKVLVALSARCEQTGAMDHIALFVESTMNENKTPYLVLATAQPVADPFLLRVEDLLGAAVLYEYEVFGWGTGLFVTDDGSGSRTVIAPPAERARVTIEVCEHLMQTGGRAALLSYKEAVDPQPQDRLIAEIVTVRDGTRWGSQVRDMSTYLSVQPSFDATLAQLGKHTRRNLRYYRRRTEMELGCEFIPEVRAAMSKAEFEELNRVSTHPVEARAMSRRYDDLSRIEDSFCVGMRSSDGRWLSLMGGRRHHGWTEVDWQVNRAGLDRLSLGTAMRSYFLENEVALGTERLYFEGGTPHTMRHSLLTEKAVDVIALRPSWRVRLLKLLALTRAGRKVFLLQTLVDESIRWQRL